MGSVLVVDDDAALRTTLAELLGYEGYDVAQAVDGRTALQWILCNSSSRQPCTVLLDLMMPGMSGEALLEVLREFDVLRDLDVILISAKSLAKVPAGAVAMLSKPFALDDLLDAVAASQTGAPTRPG